MNAKKRLTIVLLLFVAITVGTMVIKGFGNNETTDVRDKNDQSLQAQGLSEQEEPSSSSDSTATLVQQDDNVDVVYYFMTTQRCPSCMKIEAFTKEAVERNFARQLEGKKLLWKMVNVDEPQNIHFIQDYQLFTKSVVLVKMREGKQVNWKYLDQVWNLLGDKKVFQDYITSEVSTFIKEKS